MNTLPACAIHLIVLVTAAQAQAEETQKPSGSGPLDLRNPQSWDAAYSREADTIDGMVKQLISAALDRRARKAERRQAIELIGRIGNRTALEFLVEHVSLELGEVVHTGDSSLTMLTLAPLFACIETGFVR